MRTKGNFVAEGVEEGHVLPTLQVLEALLASEFESLIQNELVLSVVVDKELVRMSTKFLFVFGKLLLVGLLGRRYEGFFAFIV